MITPALALRLPSTTLAVTRVLSADEQRYVLTLRNIAHEHASCTPNKVRTLHSAKRPLSAYARRTMAASPTVDLMPPYANRDPRAASRNHCKQLAKGDDRDTHHAATPLSLASLLFFIR